MLCRVADSLFWMSRYIERAENTVRLVDVTLQTLLESENASDEISFKHWSPILLSLGDMPLFEKLYDEHNSETVADFLTFNSENPSSVYSCIASARENARMIRDQISSEMWEIINRMYLFLKTQDNNVVNQNGRSDFFKKIKEYSLLYQGTTESTFPQQLGYEFLSVGKFLERADKTGRILDSKKHIELSPESSEGDALDIAHWTALLHGCSAVEAYHRVYVTDVEEDNVVDFLILSREFPRSVLFCIKNLQASIHAISKCPITHFTNEAERLCGLLVSRLSYSSLKDIKKIGIHAFLSQLETDINQIAIELRICYMFSDIVDPVQENA